MCKKANAGAASCQNLKQALMWASARGIQSAQDAWDQGGPFTRFISAGVMFDWLPPVNFTSTEAVHPNYFHSGTKLRGANTADKNSKCITCGMCSEIHHLLSESIFEGCPWQYWV